MEKFQKIEQEIAALVSKTNYLAITFSGGKDSTALALATLNAFHHAKKKPEKIYIIYSNTLVDPQPLLDVALKSLALFETLGKRQEIVFIPQIVEPLKKDNFWICLIGRGYPPPSFNFRWCSGRLKISPVKCFLQQLKQELGNYPIVLSGVRLNETSNRKRQLEKRLNDKWMPYEGLKECSVFAPLAELHTEDIWEYIEYNESKLNINLGYLKNLYSLASDGVNGFRTGCWVCTLVKRDQSLEKLSENNPELLKFVEFRKFLLEIRDNKSLRIDKERNGKSYKGGLNFDTRKLLLKKAKANNFVSSSIEKQIKKIWAEVF